MTAALTQVSTSILCKSINHEEIIVTLHANSTAGAIYNNKFESSGEWEWSVSTAESIRPVKRSPKQKKSSDLSDLNSSSNGASQGIEGNSADKLCHTRSVAYSVELVLLNKAHLNWPSTHKKPKVQDQRGARLITIIMLG